MNIYEIAKECGVSTATVSRVLNGKSDVSEQTRIKIMAVVDQNNYRPLISKNVNNSICLFIANYGKGNHEISSPYISRLINGMGGELFEAGYALSILPLWQVPLDPIKFKLYCRHHRIAGAIIANLAEGDKFISLPIDEFPLVFLGMKSPYPWIKCVSSEGFKGAYEAVTYLMKMGHRRIMNLGGNFTLPDHKARGEGYRKALQDNGLAVDNQLILEHTRLTSMDYKMQMAEIMSNQQIRPTAFFVCDDFEVIRLCSLFDELGIRIPEDVSVVGFDDYDFSRFLSPPLTTVSQPLLEMGVQCAKIVLDMIGKNASVENMDVTLETKLIIRKSVRRLETKN